MFVKRKRRRRRSQSEGELRPAGKFFPAVFTKRGVKTELRAHKIVVAWTDLVGEKIASHCVPDGLDNGTLWVRVENSAWMHQLSFISADILAQANKKLGVPPMVKEIKFHLDRRRGSANDPLSSAYKIRRVARRERPLPPPADGEKLEAISQETAQVTDKELREIILDTRRRLSL